MKKNLIRENSARKLQEMTLPELLAHRRHLKSELADVDKLLFLMKKFSFEGSERIPSVKKPELGEPKEYGDQTKVVQAAIELHGGGMFTLLDISNAIVRLGTAMKKDQVANVLRRLSDLREIEIVSPRSGRRGAVYKKISKPGETEEPEPEATPI